MPAGRKAHITGAQEFEEFVQSIPEDCRSRGWWKIKREFPSPSGGSVQAMCGVIEFQPGEDYNGLRQRIKETFAEKKGPGIYYACPCDPDKKEIKNVDKGRFEFKENEVAIPETPGAMGEPLRETVSTMKRLQKDMADMEAIKMQRELYNSFLGKKKEDEEVAVKEPAANPMSDMMMLQMMMDQNKKKDPDPAIAGLAEMVKELVRVQSQPKQDDGLKDVLKELVRVQTQPKEDNEMKALLAQLITSQNQAKQENAFQSMMALMVKQQEEERRLRAEDEKRREQERKDELRRLEEERKEERRRQEEEARRAEASRKEEMRRLEEQARIDRERHELELRENARRFDEEMRMRREEMKHLENKARAEASEQQKLQLQLFELFKNNKDSSLETTAKIVETMTSVGMGSLKTSQEAASTIMDIAKSIHMKDRGGKEEGGGFADILKNIGQLAGPLITPYADADAKLKMLEAAAKMRAPKTPNKRPAPAPAPSQEVPTPTEETAGTANGGLSGTADVQEMDQIKEDAAMQIIVQFLKSYPDIKDAILGNLREKLGVDVFMPILVGLEQDTLEGMIANMPHKKIQECLKAVCNDEEKKLVDENEAWFAGLKKEMIREIKERREDEKAEEGAAK